MPLRSGLFSFSPCGSPKLLLEAVALPMTFESLLLVFFRPTFFIHSFNCQLFFSFFTFTMDTIFCFPFLALFFLHSTFFVFLSRRAEWEPNGDSSTTPPSRLLDALKSTEIASCVSHYVLRFHYYLHLKPPDTASTSLLPSSVALLKFSLMPLPLPTHPCIAFTSQPLPAVPFSRP